jgi:hypothetical protein
MEADEETIAGPCGRSAQVAGRADQMLFQIGIRRRIGLHVEVYDLLPFGDINVAHRAGQFDRLGGAQLLLAGVNLLENRGFPIRQELLRALAGDSAGAVVIPVDL